MFYNQMLPGVITKELNRAMAQATNNANVHCSCEYASELVEHEDSWEIMLDLPGMDSEDVEISIEKNVLSIKGSREKEALNESEKVLHSNRKYGKFERRWRLTEELDQNNINAHMDKGVLKVKLNKTEKVLPQKVPINSN
jgi:HSP20 family protein